MPAPTDFEIESTTPDAPERIAAYGMPGIGKTTWAAGAPRPFFVDLERGSLRIPHVQRNKRPVVDFDGFMAWVRWFREAKHDFATLVIDPADLVEAFVAAQLCLRDGKSTMEKVEGGYGRGYNVLAERMREVLAAVDDVCSARDVHVVWVVHQGLEKVKNPSGYDYQRYTFKLHEKVAPLLVAAVDHMLFATRPVIVTEDVFDEKRARAVGSGDRVLYTQEGPTHVAKSRARIPDKIPLSWHEFACHVAAAGFPRLLRETVRDTARRLGHADTLRRVDGMLREHPDVATLAAANKRLGDLLAGPAPAPVASTHPAADPPPDAAPKEVPAST